jgi:hypothetical protein
MKNLLSSLTLLLAVSCTTTHQTDSISKPSGFLKDYSMLEPGNEDQAQMRYIKTGVNWSQYTKIMIDKIEVWASDDSGIRELNPKELQAILSYLHAAFKNKLKENFQIVHEPSPGTLRIKLALTDGEASRPVSDTLSSIIPISLAISFIKRASTGTHLAVGQASIEADFIDAVSEERLAAAMDTRAGAKAFSGKFDKWDDLKSAFDYWSLQTHIRLNELGAGLK